MPGLTAAEPRAFRLSPEASGAAKAMSLRDGGPGEEAAKAVAGFRYDPEDPAPSIGGSSHMAWMDPRFKGAARGSLLQPEPGYRADVLSFLSPPLAEELPIAGRVVARLRVSSSAEDSAFTAKLMELFDDGRAFNICDGIASLEYRDGSGRPLGYEAGREVGLRIEMWPTMWTLRAGSRLRVDISSSSFPAYHRPPPIAGESGPSRGGAEPADQLIFLGGPDGSLVELPIARRACRT